MAHCAALNRRQQVKLYLVQTNSSHSKFSLTHTHASGHLGEVSQSSFLGLVLKHKKKNSLKRN